MRVERLRYTSRKRKVRIAKIGWLHFFFVVDHICGMPFVGAHALGRGPAIVASTFPNLGTLNTNPNPFCSSTHPALLRVIMKGQPACEV